MLVVFALAMSWNRPRDKLRLQMLLNMTPDTRIVTCNDNLHSCAHMPHVHCTFSTKRGQTDLAAHVQATRAEYSHARIVIILDYYWFQQGYYVRYGLNNWMTRGLSLVLESGADSVIFPNDAGNLNSAKKKGAQGKAMSTALAGGLCPQGVRWRYIRKHENPLWLASNNEEIRTKLAEDNGGDNTQQTVNCLHPEESFVEFTYTSTPFHFLSAFYIYIYIYI